MESKNIGLNLIAIGAVLAGFFLFVMYWKVVFNFPLSKQDRISHVSFSPDGKKLLFDRRKGDGIVRLHVYDIATGELGTYQEREGEKWIMGRYSCNGKHIVFVLMPVLCSFTGCVNDPANMQIAVMDTDGKNLRVITNTPGPKIFPSFSYSGEKIIFAKAGRIRTEGKTPYADYDFFEVDVETSKEVRLTNFKFFIVSPPSYFPDEKTFIFSAESPHNVPSLAENGEIILRESKDFYSDKEAYKAYQRKYWKHEIYKLHAGQLELEPYVLHGKEQPDEKFEPFLLLGKKQPSHPLLTPDGKHLFFHAPTYKPDGTGGRDEFFRYVPDGKHQRVSNLNFATSSSAVSPDGKLLVSVSPGDHIRHIEICQVQNSKCHELFLPVKAVIIN